MVEMPGQVQIQIGRMRCLRYSLKGRHGRM